MNALALPDPSPARAAPDDALWRLAYLITGDRASARAIVAQARQRAAARHLPGARLRGEVVAAARAHAARTRTGDPLWRALRGLPRRRRAEIVSRLH